MEKNKLIESEVGKTLNVLDDLPKLPPSPFLFTRIEAGLAPEASKGQKRFFANLQLKPIGLAFIIILNIITAIHFLSSSRQDSRSALVYSLSRDYNTTQTDF